MDQHESPDDQLDPVARIDAYFAACSTGSADDIAAHFTDDAVIWDTNLAPCRGRHAIGAMWVKVRQRWGGAVWTVDTAVTDGTTAAIEWTMTGHDPRREQRPFAFHGSEHYAFRGSLVAEIRQYWTFDPDGLDTGLVEWGYTTPGSDA